jgi:aspartyl-tRNA(Asn)/glutamyl-tRNA(Gln) amidotransferase subunit C
MTKDEVRYIASLARIHLEEKELEHLTKNLDDILGYIIKLQKLDVKNVQPTTHVLPINNVFRPDVVKPSLTQEEALSFAPAKHKGSFKVPQVIE